MAEVQTAGRQASIMMAAARRPQAQEFVGNVFA